MSATVAPPGPSHLAGAVSARSLPPRALVPGSARSRRRMSWQCRAALEEAPAVQEEGSFVGPAPLGQYWTIHNKRYDLSGYLASGRHPGGRVILQAAKGRDATELFESYHALAGDAPHKGLAAFYVEDAKPGDADYGDRFQWEETVFYDALKARVKGYFEESGRSHKAPAYKLAGVAAATAGTLWVYWTMFLTGNWWSLLLMPALHWIGPCCLLHDGSHQSLVKSADANHVLANVGSAMMSPLAWRHQHVLGHHTLTNVEGGDPDLEHFNGCQRGEVAFYGFRHHEDTTWRPVYRDWAVWLGVMAPLTMVYPSVFEGTDMVMNGAFTDLVTCQELSPAATARFWAGRAAVAGALFLAPFFCGFSLPKAIAFSLGPYFVAGLIYYCYSQVSHVNGALPSSASLITVGGVAAGKVASPAGMMAPGGAGAGAGAGATGAAEGAEIGPTSKCPFSSLLAAGGRPEWAVHQLQTTNDWGDGGLVNNTLAIGLDSQAVHHLFPSVCPSHYGALRGILREVCADFGVPYTEHPSLGEALKGHLRVIRGLCAEIYAEPRPQPQTPPPAPERIAAEHQRGRPAMCDCGPPPPQAGGWPG